MKKVFIIAVLTICTGVLLFNCKSKDDEKDTTQTETTQDSSTQTSDTSDTTSDTGTTENMETSYTEKARKLTEDELNEAQELLDRAKRAEADVYDGDNYRNAQESFNKAKSLNEDDPATAREQWELSKKLATESFYNALRQKALLEKEKADKLFSDLNSQGVDETNNDDYKQAKTYYGEGDTALDEEKYPLAYAKYNDTVQLLQNLQENSNRQRAEHESRINYIKSLIRQAEELGAEEYALEDLEAAREYLKNGISKFSDFQYDESEKDLSEAEKYALASIEKTKLALDEIRRKKALQAIMEAGETVENASGKPTINDRGEQEEGYKYQFEFDENEEDKDLNNATGGGISSYQDALKKAIEYLDKAKQSYKDKDYEMAIKYAGIAKKIAESYTSTGVKTTYRVRLIPERRDCLWRISEYPRIYGNPFFWPRIWKANKKIILNPDLIYPGQLLVIPEVD